VGQEQAGTTNGVDDCERERERDGMIDLWLYYAGKCSGKRQSASIWREFFYF
jgi:hypothetical protein